MVARPMLARPSVMWPTTRELDDAIVLKSLRNGPVCMNFAPRSAREPIWDAESPRASLRSGNTDFASGLMSSATLEKKCSLTAMRTLPHATCSEETAETVSRADGESLSSASLSFFCCASVTLPSEASICCALFDSLRASPKPLNATFVPMAAVPAAAISPGIAPRTPTAGAAAETRAVRPAPYWPMRATAGCSRETMAPMPSIRRLLRPPPGRCIRTGTLTGFRSASPWAPLMSPRSPASSPRPTNRRRRHLA